MVQCFNHHKYRTSFENDSKPALAYSCKVHEHDAKMHRAMHMHEDKAEAVLITDGSGIHIIGTERYTSAKGDLLIYNTGVLHDEIASPGQSLSTYCAAVTGIHLKGLPTGYLTPPERDALLHTGDRYSEFLAVFEMIHREVNSQSPSAGEMLHHLSELLVVMIYSLINTDQPATRSPEEETARKIRGIIDEQYMDNIKLTDIAKTMNLSRYYLSRLFKASEGVSPMQYIILRRIGEAQTMLINTDASVTEIAHMVGYNNSNHFHTVFMKTVGLTPQNYRKYWTSGGSR